MTHTLLTRMSRMLPLLGKWTGQLLRKQTQSEGVPLHLASAMCAPFTLLSPQHTHRHTHLIELQIRPRGYKLNLISNQSRRTASSSSSYTHSSRSSSSSYMEHKEEGGSDLEQPLLQKGNGACRVQREREGGRSHESRASKRRSRHAFHNLIPLPFLLSFFRCCCRDGRSAIGPQAGQVHRALLERG